MVRGVDGRLDHGWVAGEVAGVDDDEFAVGPGIG